MIKATSTFIAAVAALTLSGGAYAQAPGGSGDSNMPGGTANQTSGATGGYGMPGAAKSDSGMPNSMNSTMTTAPALPAVPNNNTLATPSVKSPAATQ
jgi:hypothetical protein